MSELPDDPVEDTLTGCNMTSIGTYIRDEFLEENNLDETNSLILSDEYIHTDTIAYQIYITEPVDESSDSVNYENELKGTCILIFKTQDDPNNGVMVLYIKDMNQSDVPFLQD